jgi:hypothetical protein
MGAILASGRWRRQRMSLSTAALLDTEVDARMIDA